MSRVHLPGVNTPQFDWCAMTLDQHPQPVPLIYEPEVRAHFIVQAALDGRGSKVVGSWNKVLVSAGSLFPGLGNHYAAVGAWSTQMSEEPAKPDRHPNLGEPVDDHIHHGVHGSFGARADGVRDPSFLSTQPQTGKNVVKALSDTVRDEIRMAKRP